MELAISLAALALSLFAIINDRVSLHDQAYERFSQLWFGMDQVFIENPHMRKYFYTDENGNYGQVSKEDNTFELAVCIAERFCDAFQYTDPLEKYLSKKDRRSYVKYKEMILQSPVVKASNIYSDRIGQYSWDTERTSKEV